MLAIRRTRSALLALLAVAAVVHAPVARAAGCDPREHRVNAYNTTVALAVVTRLNERRAALARPPVAIDPQLWVKAMWRAGRTAASGAPLVFGPDPCPGDAVPLEEGGRSFSRAVAPDDILAHQYLVDTGKLDVLLAAETKAVGIGIAFAFFHTSFVLYATDRPPPPLVNAPPVVAGETIRFEAEAPRRDLAPDLLANDRDEQGLAYVVRAEAAHGTVSIGWAGLRGHGVFYVPDPGFSGPDTLTYTVADTFGATSTGTAVLDVVPPSGRGGLRVRIGARLTPAQARRAKVALAAARAGPVTLSVFRGSRRLGSLRTRVEPSGSSVALRRLLPSAIEPGRYRLVAVYEGTTTRVAFRVG